MIHSAGAICKQAKAMSRTRDKDGPRLLSAGDPHRCSIKNVEGGRTDRVQSMLAVDYRLSGSGIR